MDHRKNCLPIYKWKRLTDAIGPQPRPRHGHRAVCIKDLMVVFGGGNEGIHDGLHVFDTDTERWYIPPTTGDTSPGRAAFGFVVDNTRIIAFGGMLEFGKYSNDLYELQASRWEWRQLRPSNSHNQPIPCPRIGHSFNRVGNKVYLFGGLGQTVNTNHLSYLNDLFVLELRDDKSVAWVCPRIYGQMPPARESHSAVTYQDPFGREKLIIYGGMNGNRLGDLWTLHLGTMHWTKELVRGKPPLPRSLHSATVMANKMFVFGGWVPLTYDKETDSNFSPNAGDWKCCNQLSCLNLDTMYWEELSVEVPDKDLPRARAGHSAIAINSRVYFWAGRDGYKTAWNNQVCCKDMWYLEVEKPSGVGRLQLASSSVDYLKLSWTKVSCVSHYILQIKRTDFPLYKTHFLEESSKLNSSSVTANQVHNPPKMSLPKQIPETFLHDATSDSMTNVPSVKVSNASSLSYDVKHQPRQFTPYTTKVSTSLPQPPCPIPTNDSPITNISVPAKTSLCPQQNHAQQLAVTTTAPIIITIPTIMNEQTLHNPKSNAVSAPTGLKTITTVANGNKPAYTITSVSKPISSHVPVPTMPLHPRSQGSDVRYPYQSPIALKASATHHSSVKTLPYLSSPTSRSQLDIVSAEANIISNPKATVTSQIVQSSETTENRETISDKSRVSQIITQTQTATVLGITPPVQLQKTSQGPVTIISKNLSGGQQIRWNIQKLLGSSQSKCVIVPNPSSQIITPKDNILKLASNNQMNQQKTTFKVVQSQGQAKQIFKLGDTGNPSTIVLGKAPSSTATSSLKPGTRFITIKRPLTIKTSSATRTSLTNIVHFQPSALRQVHETSAIKSPVSSTISGAAVTKSLTDEKISMEMFRDASNTQSKSDLKRSAEEEESNEGSTAEKIMKLS